MKTENYFFKKVVLLNFIFCACVVIIHAEPPGRYGIPMTDFKYIYIISLLCRVGVPSFYFISGMLFYKKLNSILTLKNKVKKRFRSLVIPYLLWNILFYLIYLALTHIPFIADKMNMATIAYDPTTIVRAVFLSSFSPLWFVKNLILFTIFSPIVWVIIRNSKIGILAVLILTIIPIYLSIPYMNPLWGLPIYLQGAFIGYHFYSDDKNLNKDAILRFIPEKLHQTAIVAILVVFACLYYPMYQNHENMTLFRYFTPILIWLLTDLVLGNFIDTRFRICDWMKCTFFIYCTHYFLLNVMQKIVTRMFEPTTFVVYNIFVITAVITIVVLIITATKLRTNRIYKVLTGGR